MAIVLNIDAKQTAARRRPRRGETRDALMHAALELVASETNFSALSLRHVARRAGVVPTAFYRHFDDMEALGLTLVDTTFHSLRRILRDANISFLPIKGLVRHSVELFARHVRDNRLLFQFVVRERYSGSVAMRRAIQAQIALIISELSADLTRFEEFHHIDDEDLNIVAEIVVNTVIALSERILDEAPRGSQESELMSRAEKQLRLIFMGLGNWRSTVTRQEQAAVTSGA